MMEQNKQNFLSCLLSYAHEGKVLCFGLSTIASHRAAYHILEGLGNRVANRFLHAPLGEVTKHSIGEIKGIMVDKIEDIEPPLASAPAWSTRNHHSGAGRPGCDAVHVHGRFPCKAVGVLG